jgi:hypothetical protein
MNARKLFGVGIVLVLVLLAFASVTSAQGPTPRAPRAALGTAFTYQGQLKQSGTAYTGTCDFQFVLFDAASGGNQISTMQTVTGVSVNAGLFTTQIDFGANVFNGDARWLQMSVRCPSGSSSYTPLTSRQELTPAPYALTAMKTAYKNVLVVAKQGGHYNTISAALTSITDASDTNRYLIWIAPGTYTERVTMKEYVDIEGAGELATKITYTGSSSSATGTVNGANNAELRSLTVENTGSQSYAVAIYNSGSPFRLSHLTVKASNATTGSLAYGVYNETSSDMTMKDVTVSSQGVFRSYGVYNHNTGGAMTDVSVSSWLAANSNYGVYNDSGGPWMKNTTVFIMNGVTSNDYGVYINGVYSQRMTNVQVNVLGGNNGIGVYNNSSNLTIDSCQIGGSGSVSQGIYNTASGGTYTIFVNSSTIAGLTNTIRNDSHFTTRIGASWLSGGGVSVGGGTVTCAGVYDENYTFYTSTCP